MRGDGMRDKASTDINGYWAGMPSDRRQGLGNIVSSVNACQDGNGFFRQHQYGRIYWILNEGCKSIYGGIWNLYSKLDKEAGFLGYPKSEEEWTPEGLHRYSIFQNGIIAWNRILNVSFFCHT